MKSTLFIFGRTPKLSFSELTTFFPEAQMIADRVAIVPHVSDISTLIHRLGGTVKIAQYGTEASSLTKEVLLPILLKEAVDRRLTFGISGYGGVHIPSDLAGVVKKQLTEKGITARYIESRHEDTVSSVIISKQRVVDIIVVRRGQAVILGITRMVQDFEDWGLRDFGRPKADPKAGMLPPKVARMIVNIALPRDVRQNNPKFTPTLLDPFCGVGTILAEGLLRGANVIGSDISQRVVEMTKKNIEWLRKEYPAVRANYAKVFTADATHISELLAPSSIDAIATEPYLGEPLTRKIAPEQVKNTLKGLGKLYTGALKDWTHILKSNARVVMAMPVYVTNRDVFRVKNVVDRCESLGYTLLTGPIEYSRPQAVVKREFFIFKKK